MLQVKSGNPEQLGLLYERYKKWLFNFFYQLNRNKDASEDLVQNVFMRMLKYRNSFSADKKFVPWMFQIARNENIDHFNDQIKKGYNELSEKDYEHPSMEVNIDEQLESNETMNLLTKMISRLPQEKKEMIILSKIEQLKYKEIGEIMGCSEMAARTKTHRAMKELRENYLALKNQAL